MGALVSWIKSLPADPNQGSAKGGTSSLSGMISTLVPVLVICGVYMALWLVFRRSQRRFYAPRTYLGSLRQSQRSPELPNGLFNWVGPFWKIPDAYVLQHQGLDAYLFIRFLRVSTIIAFVSLCITWPILFPVNATGGGGQTGLEVISYSNVNVDEKPNYYYAHVFVGWAVYGFVMFMITREIIFYINLRHAYLLSPQYSGRLSSRVVLFTNVPDDYVDETKIRNMYPGLVRNVWVAGQTDELEKLVEERDKVALKLEGAEVKLIKLANKNRLNADKANKKKKGGENQESEAAAVVDTETGDIAARWVPEKKRPSHRLGFLGLFGKKVDTINWGREELQKTVPEAEAAQAEFLAGNYKKVGAVFVEFNTPDDAENAFQTVTHHKALHMCPKAIGVRPEEVVWKNLSIPWWQKVIRRYAVIGFIIALIVLWAIPVGIVGLIAQVKTLQTLPGLTWIASIPPVILGVVSGLLPAVALSILMSLVPVIMRLCGRLSGLSTLSQIELFTQNAYFCFQVVQVFLVATFASSASTALIQIVNDPGSVFDVLSSSLPTSSNIYISYFIVQGLTISVGVLTQVVGMFIFRLLYKFLSATPRAMFQKWTTLSAVLWGSLLPVYTNIVVISITYSVIAPVVLFWATIGLGLFYVAYRYNLLFVSETAVDTRGLIYPRALKQLFTGIYLGEICMIGLFAVSKAIGPVVLMVIFLIFTILFQITITKHFSPLLTGISRSLAAEERAHREGGNPRVVDAEKFGLGNNTVGESAANGANGASATNGTNGHGADAALETTGKAAELDGPATPTNKKPNLISRFLKPWEYSNHETLRKLVTGDDADESYLYSAEAESKAYWPPAATAPTPTLWVPEDPAGVSKQEVAQTSHIIGITDEGCTLDEKNNMIWDEQGARPPIYTEKPVF